MSVQALTAESLTKIVGKPVPEIYVVVAKNSVLDMEPETLCGLLGVSLDELRTITEDETYREVRLLIATEHAQGLAEVDTSWDAIEQMALQTIMKRLPYERDMDVNLRVAAMANRAQRRVATSNSNVLDPTNREARVPLMLTQRLVKKINAQTGETTTEETRQISVVDGTAVNPTFDEIDKILGVTARSVPPVIDSRAVKTQVMEQDTDLDDLLAAYKRRNQ